MLDRRSHSGLSSLPWSSTFESAVPTLGEIFSLDLRSLALMRIVVGILIFFDIFDRLWLSFDHYAMLGVWPQLAASERLGSQSFSLFFAGTSTSFQVFLLLLMLLLAGMFASGLHTRIVSVALWIMMVSLHNRNELVLDCGDRFLCCALFWCMFLPLGARFSLDAALHNAHDVRLREPGRRADASADRLSAPSHFEHSSARRRKKAQRSSDSGALDAPPEQHSVATHSRTYCGVGSVALVLQFALFYWQSTRLKWAEREWRDGTALYYAFSLDHIATPMAVFALRSAAFTGLLTRLFLYAELALSVLPLAPLFNASARVLAVALCLFLHAVFALLLDLGSWAWVPPCVALALLPSRWWRVGRQATPARLELRLGAHTPAAWRVALFVAVELLFDAARVSVHWTEGDDRPRVKALQDKDDDRSAMSSAAHDVEAVLLLLEHSPAIGGLLSVPYFSPRRTIGGLITLLVWLCSGDTTKQLVFADRQPKSKQPRHGVSWTEAWRLARRWLADRSVLAELL